MMKKVLLLGVAVTFMFSGFSMPVRADEPIRFLDVSNGHWAASAIETAVEQGYVSGYPDETFKPNKEVTRAEFMRMLVDALKLPVDPSEGAWYEKYVSALLDTHIHREKDFVSDYNKPLSRMEMVRLAVRATDSDLQNEKMMMDDKSFMYNATKEGILHGMGNGELAPEGTSTRAQAVAIIERILSLRNGENLPTDKKAITYAEVELKGQNVESALGIEMLPLPVEWDYGSDVKVEVDKVIFVDMSDKDAPYREWFPETMRALDRDSADGMYLFALHINFSNTVVKENQSIRFDFITEGTEGDYQRTIVLREHYDNGITPIHIVDTLHFDTLNTVDGWYVISVSKELYEAKEVNKIIRLFNNRKQQYEYVTVAR